MEMKKNKKIYLFEILTLSILYFLNFIKINKFLILYNLILKIKIKELFLIKDRDIFLY